MKIWAALFIFIFSPLPVPSAFADSASGSVTVRTSVVETVSVQTQETTISSEGAGELSITSGVGETQTTVPYTATMDTANLTESTKYDSFTEQYNPQIYKEDVIIKNQCNAIKGVPSQATDPLKVTVTW